MTTQREQISGETSVWQGANQDMLTRDAASDAAYPSPLYGERYGLAWQVSNGGRALVRKYLALVLVALLFLSYLNLPTYLYILNNSLVPKYFFFAFLVALIPLIALKPNVFAMYLFSPFALWLLAFICLNTIHLLIASATDGNLTRIGTIEAQINEFLLVLIVGFGFFYSFTTSYERIFVFLAVLMPCSVILDFLKPGLFYPVDLEGSVLGRAAATFINPNVAGEALLLTFILSCPAVKRSYRAPLFILAGMAVFLTYSRAAITAWIFLAILLAFTRILPKSGALLILVAVSVVAMLFGGFESYLNNRNDLGAGLANIQDRLQFFVDMKTGDDSAVERAGVMVASWHLFLENPVLGAGAAATRVWSSFQVSTHNAFLMLAAEYGSLGIILWVSVVALLWRGKYFEEKKLQLAIVFLFMFFSMFSHNLFDYTYWLVTIMLVSGRRKTNKELVWARIA